MSEATTTREPGGAPGPEAAHNERLVHRSAEERSSKGKAARGKVPRESHAAWDAPADRPDPVALLIEQSTGRDAELLPIRYGRMLASPFAFYRGAAYVMASDLAGTPRSGLAAQICGDAHVSNFGLFASPERELVFDINDFDETLPGPWEWDVKRLAASLIVAGRGNGYPAKTRKGIALGAVAGYRMAMREFASMGDLDVWYAHLQVQDGLPRLQASLDKRSLKEAERVVAKARTKDNLEALAKLTRIVDGHPRIVSDPPLLVPADQLPTAEQAAFRERVHSIVGSYRRSLLSDRRQLLERFRFADLARKVVGVGSVGTRDWIVLMLGRDDDDPLFLQAKEADASVLERFLPRSPYEQHGQRVVEGQRLMQAASDIFLGWERTTGPDGVTRDFYVRQLKDWKGSWTLETMEPQAMSLYGQMCGWTLARAHARSGDRIAIASYLGSGAAFDRAIATFAETYADQNERDHAALAAAVKEGRVEATSGV